MFTVHVLRIEADKVIIGASTIANNVSRLEWNGHEWRNLNIEDDEEIDHEFVIIFGRKAAKQIGVYELYALHICRGRDFTEFKVFNRYEDDLVKATDSPTEWIEQVASGEGSWREFTDGDKIDQFSAYILDKVANVLMHNDGIFQPSEPSIWVRSL